MSEQPKYATPYRVSIWEGIAIGTGAIFLGLVGLAGLASKALDNAYQPQRAEAIARSMIDYDIPGGSIGKFGANIGGAKIAVVSSRRYPAGITPPPPAIAAPSQLELFIAQIPDQEKGVPETEEDIDNNDFFPGFSFSYQDPTHFQIQTTRRETKTLCQQSLPITIHTGTLQLPSPQSAPTSQSSPVAQSNLQPPTPLPATQYETTLYQEAKTYTLILSGVGQDAAQQVEQFFNSLRCK
jgi:hypothetical protein